MFSFSVARSNHPPPPNQVGVPNPLVNKPHRNQRQAEHHILPRRKLAAYTSRLTKGANFSSSSVVPAVVVGTETKTELRSDEEKVLNV